MSLALTGLGVVAVAVAAAGLPRVMTVDGESFTGKLTSLARGEAIFRTDGSTRSVPFPELWRVRFADHEAVMKRPGRTVLVLAGGGAQQLAVSSISLKEGKVSVQSQLLGAAVIDISAVRAVYLPRRDQLPETCRKRHLEMKLPGASHDYLIAEDRKGNWVPVPGVLKSVAAGKVSFEFDGKDRQIELSQVRAIELARMAGRKRSIAGYLVGTDGSKVGFSSISLVGGSLSVEAEGLEARSVAFSSVAEIRFESDRFVHLSELTPSKVAQSGLFDIAFKFQRDRSAAGGPIRLGGVTYARGLGLHSRCELTYNLAGGYMTFAATAGIDDAAGGRGNATLKILGDGKELTKPVRLLGAAEPVAVRCDLAGVKQLTLLVDFGPDKVGVGDHVSLADARLVKP